MMSDELGAKIRESPLLGSYIKGLSRTTSRMPRYFDDLTPQQLNEIRKEAAIDPMMANIIYRVGNGFVHINAIGNRYVSIVQELDEVQKRTLSRIKSKMLEKASKEKLAETLREKGDLLDRLIDRSVTIKKRPSRISKMIGGERVPVSEDDAELIRYYIKRDIIGYGPIDPLIRDPYIEDITCVGMEHIHIMHKAFQFGIGTNIRFEEEETLNDYLISLSERMSRPVSASNPIVDGTMPDGSRINIIYSNDISRKGSSFTIRKFASTPLTAIQLVKWGTFSSEMVAYLWLCLENKMSMMVSGETASGKTTSLNAMLPFIDHRAKIYSAEDTPEVAPSQANWQRCVSRETGPVDSRVTMFDLLRAALRSRPDYIIIGEIRGEEGRVAFQAIQTGIPVLATFHAASATKFIQRFTSDPINVPITFIDNLNIIIFQSAVQVDGKFLRRVTNIEELMGFSKEDGGVLTRNVFRWDPRTDRHVFRGMLNSYILEEKIAAEHGYADKRQVYDDLRYRQAIVERLVGMDISNYDEVVDVLKDFNEKGEGGLPFGM